MPRNTWLVTGGISTRPRVTAVVYTAIAVLPLFLTGASAVRLQSELDFGTAELGYTVSAFFAAGGLTAIRVGSFIDRVGTSGALRIGMAFSFIASLTVAWIATAWWVVAIGMASCGLAHAFTQLSMNRLLVRQGDSTVQATNFGLKQAAIPMASLMAGLGTAALQPGVPWRASYLFAASLAVAAFLLVPRQAGRPVRHAKQGGTVWRSGKLRHLAVAAGLASAAGNALSLLIVDSLAVRGFSETTGAVVLGVGSGMAIATRLSAGWLVDRRRSDGAPEIRVLLITGAIGFVVLAMPGSSLGLLMLGALLAFGAGWGWQGVVFFLATRDPTMPPATASGIVLSGTMSGSVVGPLLIAVVAEHFGYRYGWIAAALLLLVSAALLNPQLPGRRHDQPPKRELLRGG